MVPKKHNLQATQLKGDKNAKKKTSAKKGEHKDGVKWKKLVWRT